MTTTDTLLDAEAIAALSVEALEDVKGEDIRVFDTRALSPLFDRVIVASAQSTRQTKALAQRVIQRAKEAGIPIVGVEGEALGEWVLVDLGSVVVHVMQPAVRAYYRLEDLWQHGATARQGT